MGFHRRPHQSLAAVGVAAFVRLAVSAGSQMSAAVWEELLVTLSECADATLPDVECLVAPSSSRRGSVDAGYHGAPLAGRELAAVPESAWSVQSPSHSPRALLSRSPDDGRKPVSPPLPAFLIQRNRGGGANLPHTRTQG